MKQVLILGGSYAGVSTAHRLLKQAPKDSVSITLVSPNSEMYWNIASPRVLTGDMPVAKVFKPIADGFKKYDDRFKFVLGKAESVDFAVKQVIVAGSDGKKTLGYDYLIIATGTRSVDGLPFKSVGSSEETREALNAFTQKVIAAKSILLAGGGVTGVEVAGEIAYTHGKTKKISLVHLIPPYPMLLC